eukprot:GILJ01004548.1.p1 GENE.GILJ01004548.1~~GILJ01004548.1.p1  ORF type:complete len:447 (-),score=75.82 GILJ01004548.1:54-1394(-)
MTAASGQVWSSCVFLCLLVLSSAFRIPQTQENDEQLGGLVANFNDWVAKSNFPVNKLKVQVLPGMRAGAIATEEIQDNELYLSVPFDTIMSEQVLPRFKDLFAVTQELANQYGADNFHVLLFLLLQEMHNPKSFWKPYLDLLPRRVEVPLYFSEDELQLLKGSTLLKEIQQEGAQLDKKFEFLQKRIFEKYPRVFLKDIYTKENYVWATAILNSRSIWINGRRHLIPLLDMINCMEGPDPTRVHFTRRNDTANTADTKASWRFQAGEQVFENYGQSNRNYFQYHGFVLSPNSHDCVDVPFTFLKDDDPHYSIKNTLLRQIGINALSKGFCLNGRNIPSDLIGAMRIVHSKGPELSGNLDVPNTASAKKDIAVYKHIKTVCRERLNGYPTTAQEDEDLLASDSLSARQRSAILFRLSEKRLLQRTMQLCQDHAKSLKQPKSEIKTEL